MSKSTYRIEKWCDIRNKWAVMLSWWGMPKCHAEGAFMVLRAGYGGSQKYRLVRVPYGPGDIATIPGQVVDEWSTGEVKLN